MQNENKNPVWVTLPEKKVEKAKIFSDKKLTTNPDKVTNKVFWGIGFAALAVFSFMLIMPGKFSELFQGDLFDGEFKVIPDAQDQQGGVFFGSTQTPAPTTEETVQTPSSQAQQTPSSSSNDSDAIPVEVNPSPSQDQTPPASSEETQPSESQEQEVSSELQATLQSLNAQLEELKKDGLKKDQEIQSLTEMLEQQVLHNSAKPEPTQNSESNQNTTQNASNPQNQANQTSGTYKPNTHLVQLNPQQILANNSASTQIDAGQNPVNQIPAQNMNTTLSGVNSQPTTGPMESLMIAFLLSAFAVLGFGIYRNIKL